MPEGGCGREQDGVDGTAGEAFAVLANPASYAGIVPDVASVECCETHGARVFLAGNEAWKVKRPVRLAYLDFSTREQRRKAILREYEINAPHAPDIYLGVAAITRTPTGGLEIDGRGEPVEWALRMRRFAEDDVLSNLAAKGPFPPALGTELADAVAAYHAAAVIETRGDSTAGLRAVGESIAQSLAAAPPHAVQASIPAFRHETAAALDHLAPRLGERRRAGHVRRCHGDMHLGNVVLWQGHPVLFDAIEFDEALATIDTLYDLAFLLMDLDFRHQRPAANLIMNRYLWRRDDPADLDGLAALPLFMALRAGVRAMVAGDRAGQVDGEARAAILDQAAGYLRCALAHLAPTRPRLIAIGGLSGSGKSTLGAALAPDIGCPPGALHLRSDLERKAMAGVAPSERLPADAYTPETAHAVYARLMAKARRALMAGHSVVVDAVFAAPAERAAVEALCRDIGVRMNGVWLEAPGETLATRVAARRGDASDATPEVVRRQLGYDIGSIGWQHIDAAAGPQRTLALAKAALSLTNGQS